ncbi:MAG TPA: serine protease [Succinivibrionaceae bacterium]|nr:serine protease [Succinivibrionaceae bacterium]
MNKILQLKGRFEKRVNQSGMGSPKLPAGSSVSSAHIFELKKQLETVRDFWLDKSAIKNTLVSVHYSRVVAKSNRLRVLLADKGKDPVSSICGAKFVEASYEGSPVIKHVFTHYVSRSAIDEAISYLDIAGSLVQDIFSGDITSENTAQIENYMHLIKKSIAKTTFLKVILDAFYVEAFAVDEYTGNYDDATLVTLYKTDADTRLLLKSFGIQVSENNFIDDTTFLLEPGQLMTLCNNAPYLVAMSVVDFSEINHDDVFLKDTFSNAGSPLIKKPHNEPVVGVIDTLFDENVYFHEWVEFHNMVSPDIPLEASDYNHGTAVSSIIVDGPKGNPKLDDGCGHFRVRHFGVASGRGFSFTYVLRSIREIIANNLDIKVWNLSLGSNYPVDDNFISPVAAELDRIQSEYDVIFVVAGTNRPAYKNSEIKIGSPADSLNSIVVNSVNMKGEIASYSRCGPVLSFFQKPDLCYYGGDGVLQNEKIAVCENSMGASFKAGTSFAAPWITRKLAYLINVVGLTKEVAKALLIDSAAAWRPLNLDSKYVGYGIVPVRIEDIMNSRDDEIKFFITGSTDDYEIYNYQLPVPVVNNKHPFIARAVLVYFPACNRNQGVDYTSTEMDLHFGRVKAEGKIQAINDNRQSEKGVILYEGEARQIYRKWDNVKRVCELVKSRSVAKKKYGSGMWGISIITKERMSSKNRKTLNYGIVITLKEITGKNRIDEFIKSCMAYGWLVNRIDVQTQIDINSQADADIELE